MMDMAEFQNGLRILQSIDAHELGDPEWYDAFRVDPFRYLMRCADNIADQIWAAMEKRGAVKDIHGWDREALDDLKRMIPDLYGDHGGGAMVTRNPITQVYFRAGLLACREYMARFVEQGGNPEIATSIRANWWPVLGDDPGPPRLFNFDEIAEEHEGPNGEYCVTEKEISPSVEALPRAHHFLLVPIQTGPIQAGDPAEPRQD